MMNFHLMLFIFWAFVAHYFAQISCVPQYILSLYGNLTQLHEHSRWLDEKLDWVVILMILTFDSHFRYVYRVTRLNICCVCKCLILVIEVRRLQWLKWNHNNTINLLHRINWISINGFFENNLYRRWLLRCPIHWSNNVKCITFFFFEWIYFNNVTIAYIKCEIHF